MAKAASKFCFFLLFLSLLSGCFSTTKRDMINPPTTVFPTNPTTTPPVTIPPAVTTPTNPASTPLTVPSTTPVTVPPNPVTTPGAVPVTNPVTQYPAGPAGSVPVVGPPAVMNAPAVPGQSWCVARNEASEAALQLALDYACGIGGADCSQIQQGGSCYTPNTIQFHASFAFNGYYQKNPSALSCDFGGTAVVVSTNPSTASCIFPLSLSSSSPAVTTPTPLTQTVTPPTTTIPTPSTQTVTPPTMVTPTGGGVLGSSTPPIFNPANPNSGTPINPATDPASGTTAVYGFDGQPTVNTSSSSVTTRLQTFLGWIMLVTSIVTGIFVLEM